MVNVINNGPPKLATTCYYNKKLIKHNRDHCNKRSQHLANKQSLHVGIYQLWSNLIIWLLAYRRIHGYQWHRFDWTNCFKLNTNDTRSFTWWLNYHVLSFYSRNDELMDQKTIWPWHKSTNWMLTDHVCSLAASVSLRSISFKSDRSMCAKLWQLDRQ